MKQLEVQIMGQHYLLGCPEGGDSRLLEAVERVDSAMCKIRESGKVRARERIAVLAALNLAFDLADQSTGTTPVPEHALAPRFGSDSAAAAQSQDHNLVLTSLIAQLNVALGEDGRLL